MRTKHVALIALLLLLPGLSACTESEAWMSPVMLGGGVPAAGGGGCTTANDGELDATPYGTDDNSVNAGSAQYHAAKVVIAATSDITAYIFRGYDQGSSVTYTMELFTDSSNEPGTLVNAGTQATADGESLHQSADTDYEFVIPSTYEGLAAGTYWLLFRGSANYAVQSYDTSNTGERRCTTENTGSTWSCNDNQSLNVKLLGCVQ